MKKSIRLASAFLCLVILVLSLAGCGGEGRTELIKTKNYAKMQFNDEAVASGVVCENNSFSITWDDTIKQVFFTDKSTGAVYGTMPSEATVPEYDEEGNERNVNPQITSPLTVYYLDNKTLSEAQAHASTEAISDGEVYTEKIENGIRVTYDFYNQEIAVPVEYTISEDRFNITVDPTEISDNGERFVTAVSIAPFMCGIKNDTADSSFFIPDGSGIVVEPVSLNLIGSQGSARVYGDDLNIQAFDLPSYTRNIKMPIFGLKKGNNALLGIITSAASQSFINWNIGSENIRYSSIYPMFRIRGYNLIEAPEGFTSTNIEIKVFDEYISETPLTVSYYTLSGENADYNGMANKYREYLKANGKLNKAETTTPAVSVKLLGALRQQAFTFGVPHKSLKTLTTIEQAGEIAEYLRENINGDILLTLNGFGKTGLDAGEIGGGFKVASKIGSKKEINAFAEYCKKNNINLFYNYDLIAFNNSGSGFSKAGDSAKLPNGRKIILNNYDNVTRKKLGNVYTLFSRAALDEALNKAVKATENYGITGISLDSLSNSIYSDYGVNGKGVCNDMDKDVAKLLNTASEKLSVLTAAPNDYAVANCDYITEVPLTSSGYDFATYDVPFYQIVYKGYVPMTSESFNLSVDSKKTVLRCIETGVAPSYTLLYDYDNTAITAVYNNLYGSVFNGIKEDLVEEVNSMQEALGKIGNSEIKKHTIVSDGVRMTEFSNGVFVAVNETDVEQIVAGKKVAANNFVVWEG